MNEIAYAKLPSGNKAYDGTRAADHTGKGIDGKLRLFITKENCNYFPNLKKLINDLQSKVICKKISNCWREELEILSSGFVKASVVIWLGIGVESLR